MARVPPPPIIIKTPKPGQLALAAKQGFPVSLLLPIAPPSARVDSFPDVGKAPAIWHTQWEWTRAKKWQDGLPEDVKNIADEHGCNAGLRLGVPDGDYMFIAIDVDTEGDDDMGSPRSQLAIKIRNIVAKELARYFGDMDRLWMRLTRPDRATFLVRVLPTVDPGRVATFSFSHPTIERIGKLQVLAHGQQTVIGGVHGWKGGTPIRWRLLSKTEEKNNRDVVYPSISKGIPYAIDRPALDLAIDTILLRLSKDLDVSTAAHRKSTSSTLLEEDSILSPEDQAAWDTSSFISLFARMPHDSRTDRDSWVSVMRAASGCIRATVALGRVTEDEAIAMANAAKEWSSRWEDPKGNGTTLEDEEDKWERDFSLRTVNRLGWRHLLNRAIELGVDSLRGEAASWDFPDFTNAPVETPQERTASLLANSSDAQPSISSKRRNRRVQFDIKESEIQIADWIQDRMGPRCAWVTDERRWIKWGGQEISWSNKTADSLVREEIQDQLIFYVAQNHESFGDSDSTRASLTSERSVRAIESLLKARLSIVSTEIDKGDFIIQTPEGAYDLRTGVRMGPSREAEQMAFKDRRLTFVAPRSGPTPLWDSLLDHLSCGDADVINYLWAYLGYALLGQPKLRTLLIVHGPGTNGKSTLADVPHRIMGDYAEQIDRRVLVTRGEQDHPTALYQTKGKRLWCVSEINPSERWNEALVRTLSGGSDPITARGMNRDMQTFRTEGTFLIYTQFVPALHRVDEAIVSRFRMLHARLRIPDEMMDRDIQDKIIAREGPAILFRLMQEAKRVLDQDWKLPEVPVSMQTEVKRYFAGQDKFHSWFSDECLPVRVNGTETDVPLDLLFDRFRAHVKRYSDTPEDTDDDTGMADAMDQMSPGAFAAALKRGGVMVTDANGKGIRNAMGKPVVRGLKLKASIPPLPIKPEPRIDSKIVSIAGKR